MARISAGRMAFESVIWVEWSVVSTFLSAPGGGLRFKADMMECYHERCVDVGEKSVFIGRKFAPQVVTRGVY